MRQARDSVRRQCLDSYALVLWNRSYSARSYHSLSMSAAILNRMWNTYIGLLRVCRVLNVGVDETRAVTLKRSVLVRYMTDIRLRFYMVPNRSTW